MSEKPTDIDGSCHCGNIRYTLRWPGSAIEIPVRECGCTFCQKHSGAWTSNRDSALRATIRNRSLVTEYQFGTATAIFHVCSSCGAVPFVTSLIDDNFYAVVNTNTFDNVGQFTFSRSATDFEGEGVGDRLERRKRNWISDVQLVKSDA